MIENDGEIAENSSDLEGNNIYRSDFQLIYSPPIRQVRKIFPAIGGCL